MYKLLQCIVIMICISSCAPQSTSCKITESDYQRVQQMLEKQQQRKLRKCN
jgi:hypothetical protein